MHGWSVPPWATATLCLQYKFQKRLRDCAMGGTGVYIVAAPAMMLAVMEENFMLS